MFSSIDFCFISIALILGLVFMIKGFINTIFGVISIAGSIGVAVLFTPKLQVSISNSISNLIVAKILSFLLIFILAVLIINIIHKLFLMLFSIGPLKGINRLLGFLLGFAEGLLIIYFVIMVMLIQPFFDAVSILNNSFFYSLFEGTAASLLKTNGMVS